ncbi:MAG: hypothetical protein WAQ24_03595 [Candidatus Saccharimonadales bacterium]
MNYPPSKRAIVPIDPTERGNLLVAAARESGIDLKFLAGSLPNGYRVPKQPPQSNTSNLTAAAIQATSGLAPKDIVH